MSTKIAYTSIRGLHEATLKSLQRIPHTIDGVIGVPRSGMLPATWIALSRELPLADVWSAARGSWWRRNTTHKEKPKHVLLVDDSVDSGTMMRRAREKLGDRYEKVTTYAVLRNPERSEGCETLDLYGMDVLQPRLMEYNMWRHGRLSSLASDLDGVICPDPPMRGDGPEYDAWMLTVEPLIIPSVNIGHIITARVEADRPATETWLKRWGIGYGRLWMLDATPQQRRTKQLAIPHKVVSLRATKAPVMVESDTTQALTLARKTNRLIIDWSTREIAG